LKAPPVEEVLQSTGIDRQRGRSLLQVLLRQKKLVRVSEDLVFHASALDTLRAMLTVRQGTRFGVAEFKEWTGVSRKYAIPLLEFLDRERVTRREGDLRLVLQKPSETAKK
jgi:selenocysteine-specific elongation factor